MVQTLRKKFEQVVHLLDRNVQKKQHIAFRSQSIMQQYQHQIRTVEETRVLAPSETACCKQYIASP